MKIFKMPQEHSTGQLLRYSSHDTIVALYFLNVSINRYAYKKFFHLLRKQQPGLATCGLKFLCVALTIQTFFSRRLSDMAMR